MDEWTREDSLIHHATGAEDVSAPSGVQTMVIGLPGLLPLFNERVGRQFNACHQRAVEAPAVPWVRRCGNWTGRTLVTPGSVSGVEARCMCASFDKDFPDLSVRVLGTLLYAHSPEATLADYAPEAWPEEGVYGALVAMERTDSVTIDPHKLGFVPYPAGAVCSQPHNNMMPYFRDPRVRDLVAVEALVLFHSAGQRYIGRFILEGSKPGAAAAGVWMSHKVLPLDCRGYGWLIGETVRAGAKRLARQVEYFVTKTELRHAEYGEAAVPVVQALGFARDDYLRADGLSVIRCTAMDPFLASRRGRVDFIGGFAREGVLAEVLSLGARLDGAELEEVAGAPCAALPDVRVELARSGVEVVRADLAETIENDGHKYSLGFYKGFASRVLFKPAGGGEIVVYTLNSKVAAAPRAAARHLPDVREQLARSEVELVGAALAEVADAQCAAGVREGLARSGVVLVGTALAEVVDVLCAAYSGVREGLARSEADLVGAALEQIADAPCSAVSEMREELARSGVELVGAALEQVARTFPDERELRGRAVAVVHSTVEEVADREEVAAAPRAVAVVHPTVEKVADLHVAAAPPPASPALLAPRCGRWFMERVSWIAARLDGLRAEAPARLARSLRASGGDDVGATKRYLEWLASVWNPIRGADPRSGQDARAGDRLDDLVAYIHAAAGAARPGHLRRLHLRIAVFDLLRSRGAREARVDWTFRTMFAPVEVAWDSLWITGLLSMSEGDARSAARTLSRIGLVHAWYLAARAVSRLAPWPTKSPPVDLPSDDHAALEAVARLVARSWGIGVESESLEGLAACLVQTRKSTVIYLSDQLSVAERTEAITHELSHFFLEHEANTSYALDPRRLERIDQVRRFEIQEEEADTLGNLIARLIGEVQVVWARSRNAQSGLTSAGTSGCEVRDSKVA